LVAERTHISSLAQALPHPLQSSGLVDSSTQLSPHADKFPGQIVTQPLFAQNGVAPGQARLHPLQFAASELVSTQAVPHRERPGLQTQAPDWQTSVLPQG
jgi:hypothetical protein